MTGGGASVFYGWRVVAACFVIAAFAWGLGLFGASVYLQAVTAANGWSVSGVSSAITLFFLVSASVQRTVGRSIDRLGPRPVLLLGTLSMTTGVALIGQAREPWHLYPCFVLIGLGWSTLSTTGLSATVAPWFERHQGRSMTLAIMGASIGAIVGVPLLLAVLTRLGLASGLIVVGVASAALLMPLIAIVLRYRGPGDLGLGRDGDGVSASVAPSQSAAGSRGRAGRPGLLLWSAAAGFALGLTVQIGFITHHVALAQTLLDAKAAGWLVSATGLSAFIGRLVLAAIIDRINPRLMTIAVMVVQVATLAVMARWPSIPVLVVGSLIYGYGIGHVTTLGPVVVRREFGAAAFGATYGAAATVIQFTSACGPALFGFLRELFGGYDVALGIAAIMVAAAAGCLTTGAILGGRRS